MMEAESDQLQVIDVVVRTRQAEGRGEVTVREITKRERGWQTARLIGFSLLALLVAAAIPIAHFVLVPLVLLCLPFVFLLRSKSRQRLVEAAVECPACGASVSIERAPISFPHEDLCTACSRRVVLTPKESVATGRA